MIRVGNLEIVDSYQEWAAEFEGALLECEDRAEAENLAKRAGKVKFHRVYITEWVDADD